MKSIIISACLLASLSCLGQNSLSVETLSPLFGKNFSGTLMYLDYSSNEEVTTPIEMTVEPVDASTLKVHFKFPEEIDANNTSTIEISEDGTMINGQKVESVEQIGGGNVEIITTQDGEDNGKPAQFTFTYVIGPKIYSNEKFVHYEGAEKAFVRNRYTLRSTGQ